MTVLKLMDRPIAFHRCLVEVAGSVDGAVFLSQAIYWQNRCEREGGWWYKTYEDWQAETGISRKRLDAIRRILNRKGVLAEVKRGIPAKLYYKIDSDALTRELGEKVLENASLSSWDKQDCPNGTNSSVPTGQTITEITTETTPEKGGTNSTQSKSKRSGTNNTPRACAREVSFNPLSISLPDWLTPECWSEWVAHRASLKKPVKTQSTAMAILKTLDKLRDEGSPPEDVVLQSIANGWQGLFPIKQTTKGNTHVRQHSARTEHHFRMSQYQDECLARALAEEELGRGIMETFPGDLRGRLVGTVGNA